MDAIRIARALTKRDPIMKMFGSYHGHHDAVMVSIGVEYDAIGPREAPASLPYGGGIPQATVDLTYAVHFNDAENLDRRLTAARRRRQEAGLRDHGGGDDEPRRRAAAAGVPRSGSRDHRSATA